MGDIRENARVQGGREGKLECKSDRQANHEGNHAKERILPTPLFDEMARYCEAGLQLIPLHRWNAKDQRGRDRGKSPIDSAWQRREYVNDAVISKAKSNGLNLGIRLPADIVILDVDPRNFPEGRDCLIELVNAFDLNLALAPHIATGSGGHHYYFRKPADVVLMNSMEAFPGIEFKSEGRQVVAAGSVHPCGRHYEWDKASPPLAEIPNLPANVLDAARRPTRVTTERETGELTPRQLEGGLQYLDPTNYRDHQKWLDLAMSCHHATNGEGQQEFIDWSTQDPEFSDDAWRIGNRWESFHSSAPRGSHPITARLFYKEVQEAGGHVPNPEPEDDFGVWKDDEKIKRKPDRWSFLSIEELEALPPPRWLIPGVLTEGSLAAIYGEPESGKSFLAVDMSLAIASGIEWHGREILKGGVLYIAAEGAPGLGKRVRAWKTKNHAKEHALTFWLMRNKINLAMEKDSEARAFVTAVTSLGPLRLIVIDTLNQTAAGADENSAKDMSRYIGSMKRLRDATGATVTVVHHSGKDLKKGMRGSNSLLGAMDTTIEVARANDDRSIEVCVRKQKDAERESPMRFNLEKVADSLVLNATVMADAASDFGDKVDPVVALALEMANLRGGCVSAKDLEAEIMVRKNVSASTAHRYFKNSPIKEGRKNATTAMDGTMLWWKRTNSNNPIAPIEIMTDTAVGEDGPDCHTQ